MKSKYTLPCIIIAIFIQGQPARAGILKPTMIDPDVNQATIQSTICIPNYTKHVLRPENSHQTALKKQLMKEAGLDYKSQKSHFQLDHILSVSLGGHDSHRDNLQLQPMKGEAGARSKDRIERRLQRMVCDGDISLAQARRELVEAGKPPPRSISSPGGRRSQTKPQQPSQAVAPAYWDLQDRA